ncbi:NADH dehydrogenase subunit 5 [Bacillus sp. AFS037270]|uniref:NADH dehydrogenase subunit 5 n=1 Tax=Bacillus sp. AFS037270 TaxID=2033499 RepID=UPI000BFC0DC2|nr:NADH dehydrogenase subunit 5 [Bacillus sp. AFS037270]PGV53319.1 NADH-quinone oxidoreductase subunit L [Bacillus sp. AFS037270]
MFHYLEIISFPTVFFSVLAVSLLSALFLLYVRIPLSFVRFHIGIISLPPIVALLGLVSNNGSFMFGPWHFDSLSWLLALFVLTIGLIVQRYSVRYLFGDRSYRKYFTLITITTTANTLTWISNDLHLLLVCWGVTLLGLTGLIRLNKEWQVSRKAANISGRFFLLSWLILVLAVIWMTQATGHWQLSLVLAKNTLAQLAPWERTCMNLLLIVAMVIPSAQFPCQRWLLDSVVAPTPVSAVMHAGIVNAGGLMLTRFAPLFSGDSAQIMLLVLSSISVLLGTGIMLVHVDYKRQLVGSTIAQMGFMLIQCALGAYLAAIVHAILHGLFKASLFLQSGSAIHDKEPSSFKNRPLPYLWIMTGGILGLLTGIGYWLTSHGEGYQMISTFILGWSVTFAWNGLVAFGCGRIGRMAGLTLLLGAGFMFNIIHTALDSLLHETVLNGSQLPIPAAILVLLILLGGSSFGLLLANHRSSTLFTVIYLWLVHLGEPHKDLVESHPKYLMKYFSNRRSYR